MAEVLYSKRFLKDLAAIPAGDRKEIEHFVFDILPSLKNISQSEKFEKRTGYIHYYKARFGQYRIGALYTNNTIDLKRVLHRKEIYRFFP